MQLSINTYAVVLLEDMTMWEQHLWLIKIIQIII